MYSTNLKKLLIQYDPPGIGFVYTEKDKEIIKHIEFPKLDENTNIDELMNKIVDQDPINNLKNKNIIHLAILKLKNKLFHKNNFQISANFVLNHYLPITNIAIDNITERFITGSYDRTARIWDIKSGKLIQNLEGHKNVVYSVLFNKTGSEILTGSFDKSAKIWDVKTGKAKQTYWGHTDEVVSAQFLKHDDTIVTSSTDCTIRLFDTDTGQEIQTCTGHTGNVISVQIDSKASFIASASFDKTIRIWDPRTAVCMHVFRGHNNAISCCKINSGGTLLISGSFDGKVIVWDLRKMKSYKSFPDTTYENSKIIDVDIKGKFVSVGTEKGSAWIWNINSENNRCLLQGHSKLISKICFNPTNTDEIITCSQDGTIRIWNIESLNVPYLSTCKEILQHNVSLNSCVVSQCGKHILSACTNNICKLWFRK